MKMKRTEINSSLVPLPLRIEPRARIDHPDTSQAYIIAVVPISGQHLLIHVESRKLSLRSTHAERYADIQTLSRQSVVDKESRCLTRNPEPGLSLYCTTELVCLVSIAVSRTLDFINSESLLLPTLPHPAIHALDAERSVWRKGVRLTLSLQVERSCATIELVAT